MDNNEIMRNKKMVILRKGCGETLGWLKLCAGWCAFGSVIAGKIKGGLICIAVTGGLAVLDEINDLYIEELEKEIKELEKTQEIETTELKLEKQED